MTCEEYAELYCLIMAHGTAAAVLAMQRGGTETLNGLIIR